MGDEPEKVTYGLVMPYVVCEDQGGPWKADAFVGGVYFGEISTVAGLGRIGLARLAQGWYVPSELVPQLDLLAMEQKLAMTAEPWAEAPDEHTFVSFEPLPAEA